MVCVLLTCGWRKKWLRIVRVSLIFARIYWFWSTGARTQLRAAARSAHVPPAPPVARTCRQLYPRSVLPPALLVCLCRCWKLRPGRARPPPSPGFRRAPPPPPPPPPSPARRPSPHPHPCPSFCFAFCDFQCMSLPSVGVNKLTKIQGRGGGGRGWAAAAAGVGRGGTRQCGRQKKRWLLPRACWLPRQRCRWIAM